MEYLDLDLHGIAELIDIRGRKVMSRYPASVNQAIGHTTAYQLTGTEIRLVPLEDCYLTLESMGRRHATRVLVYYGNMMYPEEIHFEKETTIPILMARFNDINLSEKFPHKHGFSFNVVRVVIFSENVLVRSIHGKHRIPLSSEVPPLKMMSYGTSITQGYSPTAADLTYPNILARWVDADLSNYGLAGNCMCEPEVTDFLKTSGKYDLIVLELSVNMLANGISTEEFVRRVSYLLTEITTYQPDALILCLGVLPFYGDYGMKSPRDTIVSTAHDYRCALESIIEAIPNNKLFYIDPMTALSMENLTTDFIHPGNFGMIEIAMRLKQVYDEKKLSPQG